MTDRPSTYIRQLIPKQRYPTPTQKKAPPQRGLDLA
jgi:hypothetical protein